MIIQNHSIQYVHYSHGPEHTTHTEMCVCNKYVYYVIFEYLGSDTDQRNFSYLQMQLGTSLTTKPGLTSCSPARFSVSWPFFLFVDRPNMLGYSWDINGYNIMDI